MLNIIMFYICIFFLFLGDEFLIKMLWVVIVCELYLYVEFYVNYLKFIESFKYYEIMM